MSLDHDNLVVATNSVMQILEEDKSAESELIGTFQNHFLSAYRQVENDFSANSKYHGVYSFARLLNYFVYTKEALKSSISYSKKDKIKYIEWLATGMGLMMAMYEHALSSNIGEFQRDLYYVQKQNQVKQGSINVLSELKKIENLKLTPIGTRLMDMSNKDFLEKRVQKDLVKTIAKLYF